MDRVNYLYDQQNFPDIRLEIWDCFFILSLHWSCIFQVYYFLNGNFQLIMSMYRAIGLMGRVFTYGSVNQGSILGQVIPKSQKMVLDAALLNTQHYKIRIKGKVDQSREWCRALPMLQCSNYWKGSVRVTLD